jgi:hypothetical protein
MDLSEYLVTFYSIFVGFAASTYIVGWGNMIKHGAEHRPYWAQVAWSAAFFALMLNDWWVQYRHVGDLGLHPLNLLSMLFQPTLVYFVGILIFPDAQELAGGHLAHFLKHRRAILALTMLIVAKIYVQADPDLLAFNPTRRDTGLFLLLAGIGLRVEVRWYSEVLGLAALLFWVWRFWAMG